MFGHLTSTIILKIAVIYHMCSQNSRNILVISVVLMPQNYFKSSNLETSCRKDQKKWMWSFQVARIYLEPPYSQLFFRRLWANVPEEIQLFPMWSNSVYLCLFLCENTRNTSGEVKTGHRQSGKPERTYTCRKKCVQSVKNETQNMHKHTDTNTHIVLSEKWSVVCVCVCCLCSGYKRTSPICKIQ